MKRFVPGGAVTGIGSLPHLDPEEAVRFVAQASLQIPFWPQLPQRSPRESMIAQMLSPLLELLNMRGPARFDADQQHLAEFRRRLRKASATLNRQSASGFYAFEHACAAGAFPSAIALKGQITGPITLAHCLFVGGSALATLLPIYEELAGYVRRLGLWQIERLQRFGLPVLLFVDEPALTIGTTGTSSPRLLDSLRTLVQTLRSAGAYVGIHCCASDTPVEICAAEPDIISFDAYANMEAFLTHSEVSRFVEAGGILAFGLVPTLDNLGESVSSEAFVRWAAAAEGYDLRRLAAQSMFTATCGLGLLGIEAAHMSFTEAHKLSQLVRKTLAG